MLPLSLLLIACDVDAPTPPETLVREYAPKLDYLAPDFQLTQYSTDPSVNQSVKLSDFKGKPVLLNFWQTTCEPCKQELPELATVYLQYQKDGLIILGINVREDTYRIGKYLQGKNFDWPMLLDSHAQTQDLYNIAGFPTSFFVDKQGFIRGIKLGLLDKATLDEKLAQIMQS